MKLTINREAWLAGCQACLPAVSAADVKPELKQLHVIADPAGCTVSATNLEVGVTYRVDAATVPEAGEALLPASTFVDLLKAAPDEELTLTADLSGIVVAGKSLRVELPALDPATFPAVPGLPADCPRLEIAGPALALALRRTAFAPGGGDGRFAAVNGIAFDLAADDLHVVATNKVRLASVRLDAARHGEPKPAVYVVPPKALQVVGKALPGDGPVFCCLRENDAIFEAGPLTMYTLLIAGLYPPWRQTIPVRPPHRVPLVAGPLRDALKLAALTADDDVPEIGKPGTHRRVDLTFADGVLKLRSQSLHAGSAAVELPCACDDPPPPPLAFAARYLLDFLRVLDAEQALTLEVASATKPAALRVGEDYLYVISAIHNG